VPAWATVLIALAGTAAGAVVATYVAWMRINFEREESLRGRMLDAADDYSSSATRATNALHRAVNLVSEEDLLAEEGGIDYDSEEASRLRAAVDEARVLVDEARAHFARTQLLFGADTPAGRAAFSLIAKMSHVVQAVGDLEVGYAKGVFPDVPRAHDTFIREARRALLTPSLRDPDAEPLPEDS
jgi:hypothetical protein